MGIRVLEPNGGETIGNSLISNCAIKWEATTNIDRVKIEAIRDDGYRFAIKNDTNNDGYFTWWTNGVAEGNWKVIISDNTTGRSLDAEDRSDNYFEIN